MAKRGTKVKIDLVELEKLCAMQATDAEIGGFFNVSVRTILRRKKNRKFAEVMERGRAKGRLAVRRAQLKMLEAGNATMGVWLGKQYLGQTDIVDHRGDLATQTVMLLIMPKDDDAPEARVQPAITIDIPSKPVGLIE